MSIQEKQITYTTQNIYATLNTLGKDTEYIWLVFHGMGYLSKYFLKHFRILNPEAHYIIAPQAPSKYYLKNDFKYVGASWLTKENTKLETENIMSYLDNLLRMEHISKGQKLIVFGFSQGVSIALRWMARKKISCHTLAIYAGSIPNELKPEDFDYLKDSSVNVKAIYGNADEYISEERMDTEKKKLDLLFKDSYEIVNFEGKHEIKQTIIEALV